MCSLTRRTTSQARYPSSPFFFSLNNRSAGILNWEKLQLYTLWTPLLAIKGKDTTVVDNSKINVMMQIGNCLNLQQIEMRSFFKRSTCSWWWSRSYWTCRRATGSQSWLSWGGWDALCKVACEEMRWKQCEDSSKLRLKQAQCCHLVVHCSSYLRIMSNVTLKAHPIVMMASLFWQLLVQMDILSPLGLTLTTAPQTSSLASSNDSPTKHNSCKKHKKKSQTIHIYIFFIFKSQPSGETSNGYDSTE